MMEEILPGQSYLSNATAPTKMEKLAPKPVRMLETLKELDSPGSFRSI